jgi:hypothetical protein
MGAPFVWFDLTVADGAKIAGFYQGPVSDLRSARRRTW